MRDTIPKVLYEKLSLNTELSFVQPVDDPVIKDSYDDIYTIPNIRFIEQRGDHDFSGESWNQLIITVRSLLKTDEKGLDIYNKALILPFNEDGAILIQDIRGHKPPPWGYFGGSIEVGENPIEAVVRETKEELSIDVDFKELQYIGEFTEIYKNMKIIRQCFIWKMNVPFEDLDLQEGKGMEFMSISKIIGLMELVGDKQIAEKAKSVINDYLQ